jgi:uncharacterized protein (TIGR03083 family)
VSEHALIPGAIAVLASTPSVMRELLSPLPDALLEAPGEGGWSARDVVAHLYSRQRIAIVGRISAVLERQGSAMPGVPPSLMDLRPYRSRPFSELLAQFEEGRAEAVAVLRGVTPEQLDWRGVHEGVGELTIAEVIHHLAFHDLLHVSQAAQLALSPLEPLRGAMRVFR